MRLLHVDAVVVRGTGPVSLVVDAGGEGEIPEGVVLAAIGVETPARGAVALFGEPLAALEPDRARALRERVAVIGRDPVLVGHLDVRENVALPMRYHRRLGERDAEAKVREALESAGLTGLAGLRPHALGASQRRAVAQVRALLQRPRLVFVVDDGTELDRRLQAEVLASDGGVVHVRAGTA